MSTRLIYKRGRVLDQRFSHIVRIAHIQTYCTFGFLERLEVTDAETFSRDTSVLAIVFPSVVTFDSGLPEIALRNEALPLDFMVMRNYERG